MQVTGKQHLTGKNSEFIECDKDGKGLHREVVEPFTQLQNVAKKEGFEIAVVSGYRNFDRQLKIWNAKARGDRDVLDDQGLVIDLSSLTPWEQVQAILRWSALPGASRHHWGTDLDIFDKASVNARYQPKLSIEEVANTGPFGPMHCWLDLQIAQSSSFGFFRPYLCDHGGVAPERWHLSYAPLSVEFQSGLTVECLVAAIIDEPLVLKETVLAHIDEIYQRFVSIPRNSYPEKYRSTFFKNRDRI